MENKPDESFTFARAEIESNKQKMRSNKQDSDEKMKKLIEESKTMLCRNISD